MPLNVVFTFNNTNYYQFKWSYVCDKKMKVCNGYLIFFLMFKYGNFAIYETDCTLLHTNIRSWVVIYEIYTLLKRKKNSVKHMIFWERM